ncbi:MAG: NADH-quinone oxidoreductase subunit NuoH [Chitinophagaceae bacterium]
MLLAIDWLFILEKFALILIVVMGSLVIAMYATYAERKVAAILQDRRGPNRAGPFGLLQPVADGLKLFFKEEIIPDFSSKFLFILGPALAMLTAIMTGAIIPWGDKVQLFGRDIPLQIADIDVGVLYVFAVVSLGVYGIMIGSWASNNKYSLMGGMRAASQIISYELAMGITMIALILVTGNLSIKEMVLQQQHGWWNIFYQPFGFLIFLICAFAECNRTPFDLAEAESELVGGYHTEYSSMKLGFYLFAEYINMFVSSVIMSSLYFGGYDLLPFVDESKWGLSANWMALIGIGALMAKVVFFLFFFMWVRWTIPRFRYDQLMNLGWRVLIPLALINMLVTGGVILYLHK